MLKNHLQYIKAMAKIYGKEVLTDVKMPRKQRKDAGTHGLRKEYDRFEDELRKVIIKHLRGKGCHVHRLENAIGGKWQRGFPDLWCFCLHTNWGGWIELKSDTGRLSEEQERFQRHCLLTKVNHLVVQCVEDTAVIFHKSRREISNVAIGFPE